MKKNRAIWVALIVLAAAALLMIFVVLPQMRGNKTVEELAKKAGETVEQAQNTASKTLGSTLDRAKTAVKQEVADPKAGLLDKMARVKADGQAATVEFEALFADNKKPTVEQITAAKTKLEAALKSASEVVAPDGIDAITAGVIARASDHAKNALTLLQAMPTNAVGAKNTYDALKATLLAALDPKDAPSAVAENEKQSVEKAPDAKPVDSSAALEPADTTAVKPADAKPADAKPSDVAKTFLVPSFDVLRVEPDGSTLIAGHASPGAKIDVLDGNAVIASTEAGDSGDFVAVLDNPLLAGDHQLTLQATGKEGKTLLSVEVATVSVPADKSGELLAMVTKPGEASRIMAMPDSRKETVVAENTDEPAAKKSVTEPAEVATKSDAEQKADAKPVDVAKADDTSIVTPELPDASGDLVKTAPEVKKNTDEAVAKPSDTASAVAKPDDVTQASRSDATDSEASAEDDVATSDAKDAVTAPSEIKPVDKSATAPEVLVSAVEIEDDKIFVAGAARPKAAVRVYADDKLVAEVSTDENGRFVADSTLPLTVGNHTIRADVLSSDGKRVEFRASVPFFRPEGEQLAAVAGDAQSPDKTSMQPLADGTYDKAREEAGKAISLLKGLYIAGRTPTLDELAAARSATEIALKTLSQIKVTDDVDPLAKEMADDTAGKAAKALELLKSLPQDANAVKTALNSIDDAVTSAVAPTMNGVAANKPTSATEEKETADRANSEQPKQLKDEAASTAGTLEQPLAAKKAEVADAGVNQPKVIEQAPLQPSQSSVIIRRGDTLWQISRRVYGRGVRYTTIYVANETQIADPDRIMPGQIFGVPDKFLPNAEELHRERLDHKKR